MYFYKNTPQRITIGLFIIVGIIMIVYLVNNLIQIQFDSKLFPREIVKILLVLGTLIIILGSGYYSYSIVNDTIVVSSFFYHFKTRIPIRNISKVEIEEISKYYPFRGKYKLRLLYKDYRDKYIYLSEIKVFLEALKTINPFIVIRDSSIN